MSAIQMFKVCAECHYRGNPPFNCVCLNTSNYNTIELEFEICECCGHMINEGECANTEYNRDKLPN